MYQDFKFFSWKSLGTEPLSQQQGTAPCSKGHNEAERDLWYYSGLSLDEFLPQSRDTQEQSKVVPKKQFAFNTNGHSSGMSYKIQYE